MSFCRLLLVGGCESGEDGASKATRSGLTAWRALSSSPHYKQVTSYEDDVRLVRLPHTDIFTNALMLCPNTHIFCVRTRRKASSGFPALDSFPDREMKRYESASLPLRIIQAPDCCVCCSGRRVSYEFEPWRPPAGCHPLLWTPVCLGHPLFQTEGVMETGPTGTHLNRF